MHITQTKNLFISHNIDKVPHEYAFYKHTHNRYEILYFISGDASFNIEGKIISLRAGDLVFVKPGNYHCLNLRSQKEYNRIVFNFSPQILPNRIIDKVNELNDIVNIHSHSNLANILSRIDYYASNYLKEDTNLLMENLTKELIINLLYISSKSPNSTTSNVIIDQIINYINSNLYGDLTIDGIAALVHLSPSHVQNIFSKHMGIGLKAYITTKKVYLAQALLANGEKASYVCNKLNFGDYSTFFRAYKHITGVSPSN